MCESATPGSALFGQWLLLLVAFSDLPFVANKKAVFHYPRLSHQGDGSRAYSRFLGSGQGETYVSRLLLDALAVAGTGSPSATEYLTFRGISCSWGFGDTCQPSVVEATQFSHQEPPPRYPTNHWSQSPPE